MKIVSIDASLRSTGLNYFDTVTNEIKYSLVTSDSKNLNDEELIIYNTYEVLKFIEENRPDHVAIEGLSFNSVSSSKDLIAGYFWHLRTEIYKKYPYMIIDIVPVLTWRSPLFNKQERKTLKENVAQVKLLKKMLMSLSKEEKKKKVLDNEELIISTDIKYLTWMKVPEPYKTEFELYGGKKGKYDLSDAFCISQYIFNKYK